MGMEQGREGKPGEFRERDPDWAQRLCCGSQLRMTIPGALAASVNREGTRGPDGATAGRQAWGSFSCLAC